MVINNVYICTLNSDILSGGQKFASKVIPIWAKKYNNINYFGYDLLIKEKWINKSKITPVNLFKNPIFFRTKYFKIKYFPFHFL